MAKVHSKGINILRQAVHRQGVTVTGRRRGDRIRIRSDTEATVADLPLDIAEPAAVEPAWARYVAAVVAELQPAVGLDAEITSDLPQGVGLSSSAALEVAIALALSWKPLVKSNASAVTTTTATMNHVEVIGLVCS